MRTFNIHEAKMRLSRLVAQAAKGEPFIITEADKPLVKVAPPEAPTGVEVRRLGFVSGEISAPNDFDRFGAEEIERLFGDAE